MVNETQVGILIGAATYLVMGVGLAFSAGRYGKGTSKINGWIGIRTPATLHSQEAWTAGHRSAVPLFKLGATVLLVGAVVLAVCAVVNAPEWLGVTVILTVAVFTLGNMLYAAYVASVAARKATQDR
ncbi:hypothetical protein B2J88_42375 [Rhodococcus sp. SRB_17]|nr:hypothetical protein [Rhodococcus sp. SRB_17]